MGRQDAKKRQDETMNRRDAESAEKGEVQS
jgi:hypothetical protein